MSPLDPAKRTRLYELLADEALGAISPEDAAELEALRDLAASVDDDGPQHAFDAAFGETLAAVAAEPVATDAAPALPSALRARLVADGHRLLARPQSILFESAPAARPRGTLTPWLALAALLAVAASVTLGLMASRSRERADRLEADAASLRERVEQNAQRLAAAGAAAEDLQRRLAERDQAASDAERRLADAAAREVALARQLAEATSELDETRLVLARYEAPVDPAELQANRRKLLETPGTVRLAWAPFDLPDAPAEQRQVTGDVTWNDDLQTGYLRFVGLAVNDPAVEQYQVWIIDDRGLEQKVSGGVFNATADGEVLVPIQPGIDVRRVALFAVTIEAPGGTWVPDLTRRVVVAPREG